MKATDFEYDGIWASDKGITSCEFEYRGEDTVAYGSKINFDTVSIQNGKRFELVSSKYDKPHEFSFQICKDPYLPINKGSKYFTTDEQRFIYRWLNRNDGFHTLKIITYDNLTVLFEGSFNIETIEFCGEVIGFELTFTMGKPFATQDCKTFTHTFDENESFTIMDESDDIGYIYPEIQIKCLADGDLTLHNSIEDRTTIFKNCTQGEVISISKYLYITTSVKSHKIYNDFNFVFFRIANSFTNRQNIISASIPCEITIKYYPVIKGVGL